MGGKVTYSDLPRTGETQTSVERFNTASETTEAGHTEADAVQVAMNTNATLTQANASTMVDSAIEVYCPGMEE